MQMPSDRNVIKAGDRHLLRHLDPPASQGIHGAHGRLVVGADDGPGEFPAAVQERGDHVRPAHRTVVTLPGRSDLDLGTARNSLCLEHPTAGQVIDRKSTRLNSSHSSISYAVFCLKKKKKKKKIYNRSESN